MPTDTNWDGLTYWENMSKQTLIPPSTTEGPLPLSKVEGKPSNPKDLIGTNKVPMSLVPGSSIAYQALGHLEGHLKYGKVNWREAGVKFSIYIDAMLRHIEKLVDGQWEDPDTQVPHLSSILACAGILVDAYECGKLIDDRPKQAPTAETIDRLAAIVAHLRELHKDKNPHHYYHEGPINL